MTNSTETLFSEWDTVQGRKVDSVAAVGISRLNDGSLSCEQILFDLEDRLVVVSVDENTDEIIVSLLEAMPVSGDWQPLRQLDPLVSRRVGWCWLCRNSQGYTDAFMISCDGIEPSYLFTGMASSLHCQLLSKLEY